MCCCPVNHHQNVVLKGKYPLFKNGHCSGTAGMLGYTILISDGLNDATKWGL